MFAPSAVIDLVRENQPAWVAERDRLAGLWSWYVSDNAEPYLPKFPDRGIRELRRKALAPHLRLVVKVVVQALKVDGYRPSDAEPGVNSPPWQIWQANRMDARQKAVYVEAVALGYAYEVILPGDPYPVIDGVSARNMLAAYTDEALDEYPMWAIRWHPQGAGTFAVRVYDDEATHFVGIERSGDLRYVEARAHDLGVCPVIRHAAPGDLQGRTYGEIEPYTSLAERIDQTTLDRLIVQRYGSWKVRTVSGMAKPETDLERRATERLLEVGDLLVSGAADTKFGTLDETPLDGFIAAKDADIRELAALSQTPSVDLMGTGSNLSAEALVEARHAAGNKADEYRLTLGESRESAMRLAGAAARDTAAAADVASQVVWARDDGNVAQIADAYVKLAGAGVPWQLLLERLPGWTQTDVAKAVEMAAANAAADARNTAASFGMTGMTGDGTPAA